MRTTLTVKEASLLLGICEQAVRVQMERGLLDIGAVITSATGRGNRKTYIISREKVMRILGQ